MEQKKSRLTLAF